jgi:hypothetical protein
MAGVGHELDPHIVRVGLVAGEELRGYVAIALAEEQERRDGQPVSPPSAAHALAQGTLVVAIELHDRLSASRLTEALRVQLDLLIGERRSHVAVPEEVAGDPAPLQQQSAEPRGGDHPRVPAAPRLGGNPG